ncbi:MAG: hypothetical protein ACREX0_18730, partial [Noviherbaspirillum sp.]
IKKRACLSAASLRASRLTVCFCGNPKGSDFAVAPRRPPSFAYFSWRDKKSERLPGRPRQGSTENQQPCSIEEKQRKANRLSSKLLTSV